MGSYFSAKKEAEKIFITGLDSTGKTTFLYKLSLGEIESFPVRGRYVEMTRYKRFEMIVWMLHGTARIDLLHKPWMLDTVGVIYFVDATDREHIQESAEVLVRELACMETGKDPDAAEPEPIPLLIYANKSDLPDAMTKEEIVDKLGLHSMKSRAWYVQPSCATIGSGIFEGLDWLEAQIKNGGYDIKAVCDVTSNKAEIDGHVI